MASLSRFFFVLSSSSEVGEEERSVSELLSRSLLGLVLEALLDRLLVEAPSLVPVTTVVLAAPMLLVGASLIAVGVAVLAM